MKKIKVRDLIGKEFAYMGRGPKYYDCYGLTQEVLKRANIIIPDKKTYISLLLRNNAIEQGKELYKKIKEPEPYCIATFKIHPQYVTHMGVVLEDCKSIIHVKRKQRVTVENLFKNSFQKRLDGYYKYIGEKCE